MQKKKRKINGEPIFDRRMMKMIINYSKWNMKD